LESRDIFKTLAQIIKLSYKQFERRVKFSIIKDNPFYPFREKKGTVF